MQEKTYKKNKEFKVAQVRNLMRTNYKLIGCEIPLEKVIDDKLSTNENWFKLKPIVLELAKKKQRVLCV